MRRKRSHKGSQLHTVAVKAMIFFVCVFMAVSMVPQKAYAYTSWVQDTDAYKEFYENASLSDKVDNASATSKEKEGFLSKQLGNLLHWLARDAQEDLQTANLNLTIDGVVFGKLAQPTGVSYTSFDLSDGNIYGIVGATVYTIFRGITYSGLFIMFLYLLAKNLFSTSPKAKEDFKQGVYGIIIHFGLIYFMPQLVDIFIFLRDQFLYLIATKMMGSDKASILDTMHTVYENSPSLARAVVYCATVFATFFYIGKYISVAIQETLLFGFFCVFNLLGTEKKKFLTDWTGVFFSNLMMPVIDVVCLLLPYKALDVMTAGGKVVSFGGGIIIMFMIWSANACSSLIMKLLGNMTGTPAGRGMGGLAMMGMAAVRSMGRAMAPAGRSAGAAHGEEGYSAWKEEVQNQKNTAEEMNKQAGEITKGIDNLDDELASQQTDNGQLTEKELEEQAGVLPTNGTEGAPEEDWDAPQSGEAAAEVVPTETGEAPEGGEIPPSGEMKPMEEITGSAESTDQAEGMDQAEGTDQAEGMANATSDDTEETGQAGADSEVKAGNAAAMENIETDTADTDTKENTEGMPDATEIKDKTATSEAETTGNNDATQTGQLKPDAAAESQNETIEKTDKAATYQNEEAKKAAADTAQGGDGSSAATKPAEDDLPPMSEFDKKRYNNLKEMDDLTADIQNDRKSLEKMQSDPGIAAKRENIKTLERANGEYDRRIAETREDLKDRNISAEDRANKQAELRDLQSKRQSNFHQIEKERTELGTMEQANREKTDRMQASISKKEAVLEQRKAAERQFAQVSRDHGRDGSSYSSAKDMRLAMETRNNNNLKALEDARNRANMSIKDMRGLSPETAAEVAEIQRNNIRKANIQRAVGNIAKTTVGTGITAGGAVVGAVVAAYGGQQSSMTGAMLGGMAASGAARRVSRSIKAIHDNREEISDDVIAAGARTVDIVKDKYERDKKRFKPAPATNDHKNNDNKRTRNEGTEESKKRIEIEGSPNMEEVANRAYNVKNTQSHTEKGNDGEKLTKEEVARRAIAFKKNQNDQ